jgi:hypothetical protein
MLRLGIIGVLLVAAFPAAAQLHKCIDERGRTQYTDKPVPGCRPVGDPQPSAAPAQPKPAAKAGAKVAAKAKPSGPAAKPYVPTAPTAKAGKPPAAKKTVAPRQDRTQLASRCKSMRQEYDWLAGPRGERVENRAARIDQVKRAMNACP